MGTQPSARPILLIEDDRTLGRLLAMQLEAAGYPVVLAATGAQGLALAEEKDPAAIVLDVRLPDRDGIELVEQLRELAPVIVLTAFGSIDQAVSAIKRGAHDYLVKPVAPEALLLAIERALEKVDFQRTYALLRREAASAVHTELLGNSEAIRRLRRAIRLVAPTDATVLLLGESGTGKELAARAIHAASPRRERPFVVVDCTTLQDTLFESELFGHEKGAFTDADRRKEGLIEAAEGGTVFLDEIGDLSPAA
ncbi:MAG TPA: sigma-54-dependent Fis family transcriptional regulator, partial [Rhodospirillales bacterium]|nr:sigma-54-dependent Fis family transcriptional regulator [Rhodospirillales bacterium]